MTKKQMFNTLYWIAFLAVAIYFGYVKGWILSDFESLSPQQAYELLQKESNLTILDVRTPQEFKEEHIQGAILIPLQELNENLSQLQNVKGDKIIVYCHSGTRSVAASRILIKNGFSPVNVTGGISGWKNAGLKVVHD